MRFLLIPFITIFSFFTFGQNDLVPSSKFRLDTSKSNSFNKGKLHINWGYNRAWYSKSDIQFEGDHFNFILYDAVAKDRPTPFNWATYFAPKNLTIPQTNLRVGYFITNNWSISLGLDHMKYVMEILRHNTISGDINMETPYDGNYVNDPIFLDSTFLNFEHTDGLNYVNIESDYYYPFLSWKDKIIAQAVVGFGAGFLLPKTRTVMFKRTYRDDFNIAGFGTNGKLGCNVRFWNYFFIQTNLKGGFINMPNIRITSNPSENGKQHFWFTQFNWLIGLNFNLIQ